MALYLKDVIIFLSTVQGSDKFLVRVQKYSAYIFKRP